MLGKPTAWYLRSTPMASKESRNDREYYRQSFDSTYHPVIYELIRDLEKQAESFQIAVDPIYDKFLRDVHCAVTDDTNECKKGNTMMRNVWVTYSNRRKRDLLTFPS